MDPFSKNLLRLSYPEVPEPRGTYNYSKMNFVFVDLLPICHAILIENSRINFAPAFEGQRVPTA